MSKKKFLTICTLVIAFALLGILPASANAVKTPYTATATMCECGLLTPGSFTYWIEGGVEHYRNVKNVQYIYSAEEPRVRGFQSAVLNWNYNTKTGSGEIWGTFTHDVESGGTWRGTVNGKINEFGLVSEGIGIAKGYGELDGLLVKATLYEDTAIDLTGVPLDECPLAPIWPAQVRTSAVIIDTTGQ